MVLVFGLSSIRDALDQSFFHELLDNESISTEHAFL